MAYPSEDFVTYLEQQGIGHRMSDLFTSADAGAYDTRPLAVVIRESPSTKAPEVTEDVDYTTLGITVSGAYGQEGERTTVDMADRIYRALRLLMDVTIDGTLYLSVKADTTPTHAGFDEFGRSVYEISVSIIRYLGVINNGD